MHVSPADLGLAALDRYKSDVVYCYALSNSEKHIMSKESIGFRIESDRRIALDELASAMQCDRTTLINDAIQAYLELHHWQVELINKRLAAADAGEEGVEHGEVFTQLRKRLQAKFN